MLTAGTRPFAVVNLGPRALLETVELSALERSLGLPERGRFIRLPWERFVAVPEIRNDELLSSFLNQRNVVRR